MKEPVRGPVARATAAAEELAAAMRRRQVARGPRVTLYRRAGDPVLVAPGARGHDDLLEIAGRMVEAVEDVEAER